MLQRDKLFELIINSGHFLHLTLFLGGPNLQNSLRIWWRALALLLSEDLTSGCLNWGEGTIKDRNKLATSLDLYNFILLNDFRTRII